MMNLPALPSRPMLWILTAVGHHSQGARIGIEGVNVFDLTSDPNLA